MRREEEAVACGNGRTEEVIKVKRPRPGGGGAGGCGSEGRYRRPGPQPKQTSVKGPQRETKLHLPQLSPRQLLALLPLVLLDVLLQMSSEPVSNPRPVSSQPKSGNCDRLPSCFSLRNRGDPQSATILAPPLFGLLPSVPVLRDEVVLDVLLEFRLGRESARTLEASGALAWMLGVSVSEEGGPEAEPVREGRKIAVEEDVANKICHQ